MTLERKLDDYLDYYLESYFKIEDIEQLFQKGIIDYKEIANYLLNRKKITSKDLARILNYNYLRTSIKQRQFTDLKTSLEPSEYNKWLKKVRNTYMNTISTESVLMGDVHDYFNHVSYELNEPILASLSINNIIEILNSIDIYTIMYLITDSVYLEKDKIVGKRTQTQDDSQTDLLVSYPSKKFNRSIFSLRSTPIKSIYVNNNKCLSAYYLLYQKLGLPIGTILSSINEVITKIPCSILYQESLCKDIEEACYKAKKLIKN